MTLWIHRAARHAAREATPPVSMWAATLPPDEVAHLPVQDPPIHTALPEQADVVIVGAGFTGLWTAIEVLRRDRDRRVVLVDRERIGFGASGRNGGWCSAIPPMSLSRVASRHGEPAASRVQVAMHDTVQAVVDFSVAHGLESIVHRGGTIDLARNPAQERRLRDHVDEMRHFGFGAADYRFVDADEARQWCNASGTIGGVYTPHCAAVHPLRLVHALARHAIAAGAEIYEGVDVSMIEPRRGPSATTASSGSRGPVVHATVTSGERVTVAADVVVQATEAYSCELPGQRRDVLPIYSMMIATEPLDAATWEAIGLADRPTFADARNLIVYGQRTTDGRLAFGGRGAPYHFGSRIETRFDTDPNVAAALRDTLVDLFPVLADAAITHHWGGVLAAPRDWTCSIRFDRRAGVAVAGGYAGDGVATSALAGATLAELIQPGDRRDLTTLPIVGHRSRRWEFEPLRWLGVNAVTQAARRADRAERDNQSTASTRLIGALLRR